MRRYWLNPENISSDFVEIAGDEFHHICGVCRQGMGDRFEILGQPSQALLVEITEIKKKSAKAKIISTRTIPPLPSPQIHLCLSLPKFQTFETILEKSVELGVASIKPFFSEFSFLRKTHESLKAKGERWQRIITMATQQSGRSELMSLSPVVPLAEVLNNFNQTDAAMGLFAFEGRCEQNVKQLLTASPRSGVKSVWLFVGSEGGFSAAEVETFKAKNLQPVTLGDQVLRVETACLALVSIIKYEYGLMQ